MEKAFESRIQDEGTGDDEVGCCGSKNFGTTPLVTEREKGIWRMWRGEKNDDDVGSTRVAVYPVLYFCQSLYLTLFVHYSVQSSNKMLSLIIILFLLRKLRLNKVRELAQSNTARKL